MEASAQFVFVLCVFIYLVWLGADNDGLWFQGDAPRHVMNGIFWMDYLANFTLDVREFALQYYARYPAITPVAYPPGFYLLEALLFACIGPSPFGAKCLVLCFALVAAIYSLAWLRRWHSPFAGWIAPLLLMFPANVTWSHAVMLNVPALCMSLATLYHFRVWHEAVSRKQRSRQGWLTVSFLLLSSLTYYPAVIVGIVILVWLVLTGRYVVIFQTKSLIILFAGGLILLPICGVIATWAPTHVFNWVVPSFQEIFRPWTWLFYASKLPRMFGPILLTLAVVGLIAGLWERKWRWETTLLVSWFAVIYFVFSWLRVKDDRYLLFVGPALLFLAAIGLHWTWEIVTTVMKIPKAAVPCAAVSMLTWVVFQAYTAVDATPVPVLGVKEAADFLQQVAGNESILYDGNFDGVFILYVRVRDSHFHRHVVRGDKSLYAHSMNSGWRRQDFVASPEDVLNALRNRIGCRWIAIERNKQANRILPQKLLRSVVSSDEFELMRSMPVEGHGFSGIDIFRCKFPVEAKRSQRIPFPMLGNNVTFEISPINIDK